MGAAMRRLKELNEHAEEVRRQQAPGKTHKNESEAA